ncbi:hypothetical protein MXB_1764, partial [Myxobolus squamalis]
MDGKLSMEKSSTLEGSKGDQKGGLFIVKRKEKSEENRIRRVHYFHLTLEEIKEFKKPRNISKRQSFEETPTSVRSSHYNLLEEHRSKNKYQPSKSGLYSDSKVDKDKYPKGEHVSRHKRPYDRNEYFEKRRKDQEEQKLAPENLLLHPCA